MKHENDKPPSTNSDHTATYNGDGDHKDRPNGGHVGLIARLFGLKPKHENNLREVIEEYIEDTSEEVQYDSASIQERAILGNILKLRDVKVRDVMIPRADIIAIDEEASQNDLLNMLSEHQFSRLPVYRENLDNVLGTIHLKDIASALAKGQSLNIPDMITDSLIVPPSMHVLDLILDMQKNRRHLALVVDEHGGIDGLVTINDVTKSIVGDIHDEHDLDQEPQMVKRDDGSILADARLSLNIFEETYGAIFNADEREENDTIGGLVCDLAGRVPARGEILTHDNGTVFEILDADPRRLRLIRIRDIPETAVEQE